MLSTRERRSLDARAQSYFDFAYVRAFELLQAAKEDRSRQILETRLRLAMHLAPKTALVYNPSNPTPRWRLVCDFLVIRLERPFDPALERLARAVSAVLDGWDSARREVTNRRRYLLKRDGPRCSSCHVHLTDSSLSLALRNRDNYKPYHTSPDELMAAEVDHIEAISGVGTNDVSNLQLLCRLCNAGKGDGLGVEVRREAEYAGYEIADIPVWHRSRILYYVLDRDNNSCTKCRAASELTIRKDYPDGAYVRSNLTTWCYTCIDAKEASD